jgi:hypothetical protein
LEQKLRGQSGGKKDQTLTFEQMGVDFLFVDEAHCFRYDTPVATDRGMLPIGLIVDQRLPVKVASYDHKTGVTTWRRIHNYWRHDGRTKEFVSIDVNGDTLQCTRNHQVYVEGRGYVRADSIKVGESLRLLPKAFYAGQSKDDCMFEKMCSHIALGSAREDGSQPRMPTVQQTVHTEESWSKGSRSSSLQSTVREGHHQATRYETMSALRGSVLIQEFGNEEQREAQILRSQLQQQMDYKPAWTRGEIYQRDAQGYSGCASDFRDKNGSNVIIAYDGVEPYDLPGNSGEDASESFWAHFFGAWGKWTTNKTTTFAASGHWPTDGICDPYSAGSQSIREFAKLLQSRSRRRDTSVGDRGRRANPQAEEVEIPGSSQDRRAGFARVDGVEIHERGSDSGPGGGGQEDRWVYDLGIEGEHNYFASCILVHNSFRKLQFATRQQGLKGIDPTGSNMAFDLYTKVRYLDRQNPGRAAVFASGTPVTNTMGELYSLSRFMQPQALADKGLSSFDAWAQTFGDTKTGLEETAAGTYQPVTRFGQFLNLPELYKMVGEVMDIVTPAQLEQYVTRPQIQGGKREFHLAPRTALLDAYQEQLGERMEAIKARGGKAVKGQDILLSVIGDGRHAAIDPRFVMETGNDPNSKLNIMIRNVARIHNETADHTFYDPRDNYKTPILRGPAAQMIFSNLGVNGRGPMGFSGYKWIKEALRREGIPDAQIAIIGDYKTAIQRQALFNDINEGKVRVLIGSTQKMGTGVNAQRRLVALHNLDPLWYPSDDEQRVGRILRQGNLNPEIQINDYSTKGTYDSAMWKMMGNKARFIEQFFRGDPELRNMEDLGEASMYEQASAMSTTDERIIALTELKQNLDRARRREDAHNQEQFSLRRKLENRQWWQENTESKIANIDKAIARRQDTSGDAFSAAIGGQTYEKRTEAGDALDAVVKERSPGLEKGQQTTVGQIGGFPIVLDGYWGLQLRTDNGDYSIHGNGGRGKIASAESIIRGFDDDKRRAQEARERYITEAENIKPLIGKKFEGGQEIADLASRAAEMEKQIKERPVNTAASVGGGDDIEPPPDDDEPPPAGNRMEGLDLGGAGEIKPPAVSGRDVDLPPAGDGSKLYSFPGMLADPDAWKQLYRATSPVVRPMVKAAGMAVDAVKKVANATADNFAPMRTGSVRAQAFAADFANSLRQVMYRYGEIDREITRNFNPEQRDAMGRALDAQSVFEQRIRDMGLTPDEEMDVRRDFDRAGTGLTGLQTDQRNVIEMLNALSIQTWRRLQERGLVEPDARPIPYYMPRQLFSWTEENGYTNVGSGQAGSGKGIEPMGGNLTTAGPMRREHLTPEQTEAAARAKLGRDVNLLRDIRSLPARLAYSERAIAGVDLINRIADVGKDIGVDTVVRGDIPGDKSLSDYFTIADHPSFRQWTGAGWRAVNVAREFEGPLKAVLTRPSPEWYKGAQALKGGIMSAIMYSPFIHLAVELGRTLPVMPGKVLSFKWIKQGSVLRRNLDYMDTAIRDGVAPLGHTSGWGGDPASLADQAFGESRYAFVRAIQRLHSGVANRVRDIGGQTLSDIMMHPHQTLLWDQVFNLQMSIYDTMRSRYIEKGFEPAVAGTMAAHIANRYAGALPPEHLHRFANMAANLLLFSRSFTLGNLGVMKDMFTGAPPHIQARIEQMAGPEVRDQVKAQLRRKAVAAVAMDIGIFYLGVALVQLGLEALTQGVDETYNRWLDEARQATQDLKGGNPLAVFEYLPQHWNEPGKQDRVYAGVDDQGRGVYLRLPPGKVGEEFIGWAAKPGVMLENKSSPIVRPIIEVIMGHDSLGRALFPPNPQTIGDYGMVAALALRHIVAGWGPTATLEGAWDLAKEGYHHVVGQPTQGSAGMSALKVLGPATGVAQISSGFPGGPAAGEMHAFTEQQRYDWQQKMPAIRDQIKTGDVDGAQAVMQKMGMPPSLQKFYIQQTQNPGPSKSSSRQFERSATPEDKARLRLSQ